MSDLDGTAYMTNLKNELNAMPTLLATVVAVIDEALYDDDDVMVESLNDLVAGAKAAADAKAAAAAAVLETYTAPPAELEIYTAPAKTAAAEKAEADKAAADKAVAETAIKNLKVYEESAGKDDKRKFTITFTPGKDIVMGTSSVVKKITFTGLNNSKCEVCGDSFADKQATVYSDECEIFSGSGQDDRHKIGNRNSYGGFRISYEPWGGSNRNKIEIDYHKQTVSGQTNFPPFTFKKDVKLMIVFVIDAPFKVDGKSDSPYQNLTGNKIGVQIWKENKILETTLSTYFKGRAPNPDKPYPTVGEEEEEEEAADATKAANRSLEEKLELMRSINVELVELIKSKLL